MQTAGRIRADFGGACVGALATLPQAVAYGLIAISPLGPEWAVFGIMASVGSAIVFGLLTGAFSSNPYLISGPRAVTALVVATAIAEALQRGHTEETAVIIGMMSIVAAGLFQVIFGTLRLGRTVAFMPIPVLSGFVTASALLVFVNSLPMALGLPDLSPMMLFSSDLFDAASWAILVSGITIGVNFLAEGRIRVVPAALIGLIAGTAAYYLGVSSLGQADGPVIGHIDLTALLQTPIVLEAATPWEVLLAEADIPLLAGLSIGLLAAFDTVLSGAALDRHSDQEADANRDLLLHGGTNILMGFFGFLPGSGTLSRSTAAINAGAETRAANVGTALVFALMLILLAPVVAALPLWATAGMLIATALQAVDRDTISKIKAIIGRDMPYRRVLAGDVLVTLCVVVVALLFDLIAAIGVGMVLAVVLFVVGMGREPVRRRYTGARVHSNVLRPVSQIEVLEKEGHRIGVIELQGALFFGTSSKLQEQAKRMLAEGVEYLVLDFRYLSSIDSTGCSALRSLSLLCREAGGKLYLSCVEPERRLSRGRPSGEAERRNRRGFAPRWVWLTMDANGLINSVGIDNIRDDTDSALSRCEDTLLGKLGRLGGASGRGVIANSQLFAGFSRQDIVCLAPYVTRHHFAAGDSAFEQNASGDEAYFILSGRMRVLLDIPGSVRKRRVSVLTEGTIFGEMGLLDGAPRSASVVATDPTACFSISRSKFGAFEAAYPKLALMLMRNLNIQFAERLRIANTMISELEQ